MQNEHIAEIITSRIKEARKSTTSERTGKRLTQEGLAEKLGYERPTVQRWESNRELESLPGAVEIPKICDALKCDAGYLFGEYDEKTREVTDIKAATGLQAHSVEQLLQLRDTPNELDFDMLDFIDYLLNSETADIPLTINALLKIPKGRHATPETADEESRLYAELYYRLRHMIDNIRKEQVALAERKEKERLARERANAYFSKGGSENG